MALSEKKEEAEAKLSGVVSMKNITGFGETDVKFWVDKWVKLGVFTSDALLENFMDLGMFNKDFMDEEFLDLSEFEEDAIT
ncbi:unnamed protein product [Angiostrongylus costaricensis]|uniref:Retrotransposon protein n=1 Tax=Angiostrongylus costaricensis TaxID=334426 RepID=A0A0R3PBF4_ANGCS|nr:unnamed protein product [Angiostrongylus costaricensis]